MDLFLRIFDSFVGMLSLGVIVFMLGMGVFFYKFFAKKMAEEDKEREKNNQKN